MLSKKETLIKGCCPCRNCTACDTCHWKQGTSQIQFNRLSYQILHKLPCKECHVLQCLSSRIYVEKNILPIKNKNFQNINQSLDVLSCSTMTHDRWPNVFIVVYDRHFFNLFFHCVICIMFLNLLDLVLWEALLL